MAGVSLYVRSQSVPATHDRLLYNVFTKIKIKIKINRKGTLLNL